MAAVSLVPRPSITANVALASLVSSQRAPRERVGSGDETTRMRVSCDGRLGTRLTALLRVRGSGSETSFEVENHALMDKLHRQVQICAVDVRSYYLLFCQTNPQALNNELCSITV